ncbi:hypothetical protein [Virgibacillus doumboii]|uniref:hypothetical protein n=1 Tax=Virgibacillus doumboii TaxID=2697503 RepID=UPI0013DFB81C|nr:hypothetical protein [Virgibacillus doumboii]
MKLISKIQEKCKERNKLFLILDVLFSLLTLYFAIRLLFVSTSALANSNDSTDLPYVLAFAMSLSLGLSWTVRVVEMLVTGKRKYFILHLIAAIIALGVSVIELRWLLIW